MLLAITKPVASSRNQQLTRNGFSEAMQTPRTPTTFQHFLHNHPLELTAARSQSDETQCSACEIQLVPGRHCYSCTTCPSYSLHRPCFNMPRQIRHPADPDHDLNLVPLMSFGCKACGDQGSGFSYNCDLCQVKYHCLCMLVPLTKLHGSHPHELELKFTSPYGKEGFNCDLCDKPGSDQWLYRCDDCGFDVHMGCLFTLRAQPDREAVDPTNYSPSAPVLP